VKGRYKVAWIRTAGVLYFQKAVMANTYFKVKETERRTGNENSYFSRRQQKNDVRNDVHVQMYVYVLYVAAEKKNVRQMFRFDFAFIDRA